MVTMCCAVMGVLTPKQFRRKQAFEHKDATSLQFAAFCPGRILSEGASTTRGTVDKVMAIETSTTAALEQVNEYMKDTSTSRILIEYPNTTFTSTSHKFIYTNTVVTHFSQLVYYETCYFCDCAE